MSPTLVSCEAKSTTSAMIEGPESPFVLTPIASTIWELLDRTARRYPEKGLLFVEKGLDKPVDNITYPQLCFEALKNGQLLRSSHTVVPGQIVVTYFDTHKENIIWFWSVVAAGGIPAILSPLAKDLRTRAAQLENVVQLFQGPTVITSIRLVSDITISKGLRVATIESLPKSARYENKINGATKRRMEPEERSTKRAKVPTFKNAPDCDELAVLLFTSGSTGPAKAVEFTHSQLIASAEMKSTFHDIHSDMNFMSWVSFDHSANFCEIHLSALYSGSNQVHVATADLATEPASFFDTLSTYEIGYVFAPNFFLAAATKAFRARENPVTLNFSKLSVIMTGGEACRVSTIAATDSLLVQYGARPNSIKAAYGLSETCSACFYNTECPNYDLANGYNFASVGKHHRNKSLKLRIVNDHGLEQPPRTAGAIQLCGEIVFRRYFNNTIATNACIMSDGWFDTGDTGLVDEAGNLRIVGRSKEVIIINANNYSSFEIEHAIESRHVKGLTISYTAAFSSWDQGGDSESVVVLFNPTDDAMDAEDLQATIHAINMAVIAFCSKPALAIIPLPKDQMPKSTIGKLSRRKLKESFERGLFDEYRVQTNMHPANERVDEEKPESKSLSHLSPLGRQVAEIFSRETGICKEKLAGDSALLRSGLDSLGYMRIKKALEAAFHIHQEIPIGFLLRSASIPELETSLLSIGTAPLEYNPIVPLSLHGSKHPLFLFHPGSGEFLCWMRLLPFLPDRPVYALRAKGVYEGEGSFVDLEDMLTCYLEAIKQTQPHGPYALLGYCLGGTIAFELVKRLEALGDEVVFVGGIDNPPDLERTMGRLQHRTLMIDLLPAFTSYTREEADNFGAETAHMSDEQFYQELYSKFPPEFIENMDITPSRLTALGRVENSMRLIASTYTPSGSISKYDCFCADPMPHFNATPDEWRRDILASWKDYCGSEVRYHDIAGNHSTALKEPHLNSAQSKINDALVARGI